MTGYKLKFTFIRVIKWLALIGGLIAATTTPLMASSVLADQSLKTLRAREAEEQQLDREASFTSNVCGTSIRASIDWAASANWPENVSLAKACDGALGALEAICRGNKSRGARVRSFVCAGDGSGPDLSGGTLTYGASPNGNGFGETKSYLEDEL